MTKWNSEFDLEDRLIDFAVRIIRTSEALPKTKVGKHIAGQLIRSGNHRLPITAKRKAQNRGLILSIR